MSSAGRPRSTRSGGGTKCAFWYLVTVQPGATAELRLRLRPKGAAPAAPAALGGDFDAGHGQPASRGRRVLRRTDAGRGLGRRGPGDAPGLRRDALEQAALLLRRVALARGRPDAACAPRRRVAPAATPGGDTSTPSTSCRCRTSGSTRGSRRGTWPSTAWLWPTWIPVSPSTSSSCCAASGSSIRTEPSPPTSGTSATSTPPCRPGPRSRSSPSTEAGTSPSSAGFSTSSWSTSRGGSTSRTRRAAMCSRAASSASTTSGPSTGRICRSAGCWSSPTPRAGWPRTPWRWSPSPASSTAADSGRPSIWS